MNVIPIKCPSCGAKVKADAGSETVSCNYCGTESFVQRRAGALERVVQLPEHAREMPVATEAHSGRWVVLLLLLPAVCVIAPLTSGFYSLMSIYFIGTSTPVLVDVDSDGDKDIISFAKRSASDDAWIGAWDGSTGDNLWKTDTIGELGDAVGGILAVLEGTALFVSAEAKVTAYDARTGDKRWEVTSLGERAHKVCVGDPGFAIVQMRDMSFRQVALSDGAVTPIDSHPCPPAATSQSLVAPEVEFFEPRHMSVGDLRAELAIRRADRWLVGGAKQKGSAIPMLAAVQGPTLTDEVFGDIDAEWQTAIPGVDPLKADTNELHLAVSDDLAFAAYEMRDRAPRLTAIAIADGTRKWDVELGGDNPLARVAYADGRVYVAMWASLFVHDANSGAHLYTIGH